MTNEEQQNSQQSVFAIQTDIYTGPLDLLIDLIERRKLLINDISLATVTDDYMRYVAVLERSPLKETAEFVVLAATLLLIKSKSLLPLLDLTESEEGSVEELQDRLKHYQIFRNAGKVIEALFGKNSAYERTFIPDNNPLFTPDSYTEIAPLCQALHDVIHRLPKIEQKQKVAVRKTVSLEEVIDRLKTRIERQLTLTFKDFTGGSGERGTVIVSFLAVLEMVKQGSVMVQQVTKYQDFEIRKEGSSAPKYL